MRPIFWEMRDRAIDTSPLHLWTTANSNYGLKYEEDLQYNYLFYSAKENKKLNYWVFDNKKKKHSSIAKLGIIFR